MTFTMSISKSTATYVMYLIFFKLTLFYLKIFIKRKYYDSERKTIINAMNKKNYKNKTSKTKKTLLKFNSIPDKPLGSPPSSGALYYCFTITQ